jgi:hypothetical protein
MRNILAKLPEDAIDEFRQTAKAAYEVPSPAVARALRLAAASPLSSVLTNPEPLCWIEETYSSRSDSALAQHAPDGSPTTK